jgi:hypothetical protein
MSHTPGPWLTTESTEHWGRVNVTIQAAFTANDIATAWQGNTETNRANARLIAAAPELLEALEQLYHLIDNAHDGDRVFTFELAQKAKAAIAKARGQG